MIRRVTGIPLFVLAVLLAAACAGLPAAAPAPTAPEAATAAPTLIPADSDSPAAGICGAMEGETATFVVSLDVPSPRCAQVYSSQRLEIVNATPAAIVVTFAGRDLPIEAGASFRIEEAFGSYLAPGVHFIFVTQGTGNLPELWLLPS